VNDCRAGKGISGTAGAAQGTARFGFVNFRLCSFLVDIGPFTPMEIPEELSLAFV
jgi:hypothetical protein